MLGKKDLQKAINTKRYEGVAKNVIFFVGDGMGVPTHTMARIYKVGSVWENFGLTCFLGPEKRRIWRGRKSGLGRFSFHRIDEDLQHRQAGSRLCGYSYGFVQRDQDQVGYAGAGPAGTLQCVRYCCY
jgi:hypothetical protein